MYEVPIDLDVEIQAPYTVYVIYVGLHTQSENYKKGWHELGYKLS